jgi:hypothetical protein
VQFHVRLACGYKFTFNGVTGSWSTFLTAVIPVHLSAGSNTVKLSNAAAYAPDIDKISIASVVG